MNNKIKKWLLISIIFVQIITIVGFVFFIRNTDRKYSNLIDKEISNFRTFVNLITTTNENFIRLTDLLDNPNPADRVGVEKFWNNISALKSQSLDSIQNRSILNIEKQTAYRRILLARNNYVSKAKIFVDLINNQSADSLKDYYFSVLKPSYIDYQKEIRLFSDHYRKIIFDYNSDISKQVSSSSFNLLLLGVSPLIIILFFVLLQIIILLYLILKFKDMDWDR